MEEEVLVFCTQRVAADRFRQHFEIGNKVSICLFLGRLIRKRVPTGAGEDGSVLALLQCIPTIQL